MEGWEIGGSEITEQSEEKRGGYVGVGWYGCLKFD